MVETPGVDFSTERPDPGLLTRYGFRFVMGYLKPLAAGRPSPMELDAAHIKAYRAAGLQVGVFWETAADRALSGAAGGTADGAAAVARAKAVGYPPGCVIVAAVDFPATAAQLPACVAYLLAFDDAVRAGGHPGGAYGSFAVVEAVHAARPTVYLVQTAAWSGGQFSTHAHIYQRAQPSGHWPVIPGCDEDVLCQPLPLYGATLPEGADMPLTLDDFKLLFYDTPFRKYPDGTTVNLAQFLHNLDDMQRTAAPEVADIQAKVADLEQKAAAPAAQPLTLDAAGAKMLATALAGDAGFVAALAVALDAQVARRFATPPA